MKSHFKILSVLSVAIILTSVLTCGKKKEKVDPVDAGNQERIVIKGSDTELELVNYFASEFASENDGVHIEIEGGGSGEGIAALLRGECDIANSSREITDQEREIAAANGIDIYEVMFAVDAVAFITHPEAAVTNLTLEQLKDIYDGKIKNWKELGGEDLPIRLFGRNSTSGTHYFIRNKLNIKAFTPGTTEMKSNDDIYKMVRETKGAIGYVSLSTIMDVNGKPVSDVWAINVSLDENQEAVSPYQVKQVLSGGYPLNRPLYQYFNGMPEGAKSDFLYLELSDDKQASLREFGYFPITYFHTEINRKQAL